MKIQVIVLRTVSSFQVYHDGGAIINRNEPLHQRWHKTKTCRAHCFQRKGDKNTVIMLCFNDCEGHEIRSYCCLAQGVSMCSSRGTHLSLWRSSREFNQERTLTRCRFRIKRRGSVCVAQPSNNNACHLPRPLRVVERLSTVLVSEDTANIDCSFSDCDIMLSVWWDGTHKAAIIVTRYSGFLHYDIPPQQRHTVLVGLDHAKH